MTNKHTPILEFQATGIKAGNITDKNTGEFYATVALKDGKTTAKECEKAALIIKAFNCHDELLEALEALLKLEKDEQKGRFRIDRRTIINKVNKAISKARGEK